jgi:uncharacterized membrane protein
MKFNFYTALAIILGTSMLIIYFLALTTSLHLWLLVGGNLFITILTVLSYRLLIKSAQDTNPRKFVNAMLASSTVRIFSFAIAMACVGFYYKSKLGLANVLILFILYIIYSMVEHSYVMKANKKFNQAV